MKIRNGFVSNSSSSSFIASLGSFDSTLDIALAMIPLREYENDKDLCEKVEKLKSILPAKTPITFNSTNYKTYIYIEIVDGEEVFVIDTCNNHPFSEIEEFRFVPEDFEDKMEDDEITLRQTYYYIELDLLYEEIPYNGKKVCKKYCDKHYEHHVKLADGPDKGKIVCASCYCAEQEKKKPVEIYLKKCMTVVDFDDVAQMAELNNLWRNAVELSKRIAVANEEQKANLYMSVENIIEDLKISLIGKEIYRKKNRSARKQK